MIYNECAFFPKPNLFANTTEKNEEEKQTPSVWIVYIGEKMNQKSFQFFKTKGKPREIKEAEIPFPIASYSYRTHSLCCIVSYVFFGYAIGK